MKRVTRELVDRSIRRDKVYIYTFLMILAGTIASLRGATDALIVLFAWAFLLGLYIIVDLLNIIIDKLDIKTGNPEPENEVEE